MAPVNLHDDALLVGSDYAKILVLGCKKSGKSCLIARYVCDCFSDVYSRTLGALLSCKSTLDTDSSLDLAIWELSSDYLLFFREDVAAIIILCDMTSSCVDFLKYSEYLKKCPTSHVYLVGTKSDLPTVQKTSDLNNAAQNLSATLKITSAKTGAGIMDLFDDLRKKILKM